MGDEANLLADLKEIIIVPKDRKNLDSKQKGVKLLTKESRGLSWRSNWGRPECNQAGITH